MKFYIEKTIRLALISAFISSSLGISSVQAGEIVVPVMPAPGIMVNLSPAFTPAYLKGIVIHPDNALKFDFLVHKGDGNLNQAQKTQEYNKMIKYFLAALTVPDKDQWVNLSPYEKDRIIEEDFGKTEMGRDLLGQDYLLKQITSSLMYPESGLGKSFWGKVYQRAQQQFGSTNIPVNTFNKVWIVPDQALIYESGNTAYVVKSHLKVMLEEDYVALNKSVTPPKGDVPSSHTATSQVIKEIILPAIEKEVNEGKNFAQLRQVFSAMLLATWYKKALKESLLGKIYADKAKVQGVNVIPTQAGIYNVESIYQQYLAAFKKGVYNYIKEDIDPATSQRIPRKYFAGGFDQEVARIMVRAQVSEEKLNAAMAANRASATEDFAAVALDQASATTLEGKDNVVQNWVRVFDSQIEAQEIAEAAKTLYTAQLYLGYFNEEQKKVLFTKQIAMDRAVNKLFETVGKYVYQRIKDRNFNEADAFLKTAIENSRPAPLYGQIMVQGLQALASYVDYWRKQPTVTPHKINVTPQDFPMGDQRRFEWRANAFMLDHQQDSAMNARRLTESEISALIDNRGDVTINVKEHILRDRIHASRARVLSRQEVLTGIKNGTIVPLEYNGIQQLVFANGLSGDIVIEDASKGLSRVKRQEKLGDPHRPGRKFSIPIEFQGPIVIKLANEFEIRVIYDSNEKGYFIVDDYGGREILLDEDEHDKYKNELTKGRDNFGPIRGYPHVSGKHIRIKRKGDLIILTDGSREKASTNGSTVSYEEVIAQPRLAPKAIVRKEPSFQEALRVEGVLEANGSFNLKAGRENVINENVSLLQRFEDGARFLAVAGDREKINEIRNKVKNELKGVYKNRSEIEDRIYLVLKQSYGIDVKNLNNEISAERLRQRIYDEGGMGLIGPAGEFISILTFIFVPNDVQVFRLVHEKFAGKPGQINNQSDWALGDDGVKVARTYKNGEEGKIIISSTVGQLRAAGVVLGDNVARTNNAISLVHFSKDTAVEYQKVDEAMIEEGVDRKGGIDFNSANLAMVIKRDGKGVPLPLAQQDMAQLVHIGGFVPRILEIKPVSALLDFNQMHY